MEVLAKYKEYEAWMQTQHGRPIKVLQSYRGGEYLSKDFDSHLKANSTIRSLTVHDTPEENGIAERLNRTLLEHARAILMTAQLLKVLWPETMLFGSRTGPPRML